MTHRNANSSHWYYPDGTPCHEVPKKDGGMRPTHVGDARKLGLFPSVTNILAVKAKEQLVQWRVEQAIRSAMRLTRLAGEDDDTFAQRILEAAETQVEQAADLGTLIHAQIDEYLTTGAFSATGEIARYLESFEHWNRERVVEVVAKEAKVVGRGYAGRFDLCAVLRFPDGEHLAMIDFKTQKCSARPKANFYPEWPMQLAAYAQAFDYPGAENARLVSVVIPSDEPGPLQEKTWENGREAWAAFQACQALWSYEKNYWP